MNKYVALDTETGGVTLDTSLLTAYLAILDENFGVTTELSLKVKPEDGRYVVTAQALAVNKINLIEHDKVAITYKAAKPLLYNFLKNNFTVGQDQFIPIGHGIYFDIIRLKQDLISEGSWEQFVSYRLLDTSNVVQFLRAAGLFPNDVSGSLGSLMKHFGITPVGELHDARNDTISTVDVLQQLFKIIKR